MEERLQKLRWRISADSARRGPSQSTEEGSIAHREAQQERAAEEVVTQAEAAEQAARDKLKQAEAKLKSTTTGADRSFFFTTDG